MLPVPICTPGWRETMWGKVTCLRNTQWKGLGVESPTFRSEVQHANHYTTTPPTNFGEYYYLYVYLFHLTLFIALHVLYISGKLTCWLLLNIVLPLYRVLLKITMVMSGCKLLTIYIGKPVGLRFGKMANRIHGLNKARYSVEAKWQTCCFVTYRDGKEMVVKNSWLILVYEELLHVNYLFRQESILFTMDFVVGDLRHNTQRNHENSQILCL